MNSLGRAVLLAMIPLNLILIVWVWIGRLFAGAGGWFMLMMVFSVVPVLLVALFVTTLLGFLTHVRPRVLTGSQAIAQLLVWAGMLAFGFFIVDFGDTDDSINSVFTRLVGSNDATQSISWTIAAVAALVTVVAWVALLVLQIAQRRRPAPYAAAVEG